MMHSLPRRRSLVIVVIGVLMTALLMMSHASYATTFDGASSKASFQIHLDQTKPGNPGDNGSGGSGSHGSGNGGSGNGQGSNNGDVAQPEIPENGQEIHYSADGQSNGSTGKLPQTSAVQNSLLTFVGIAMMLMAIVWRRQRRATKEEGYYED